MIRTNTDQYRSANQGLWLVEMAYNTGFNINVMIKNSASAGLILDDRRSKLLPETVEKLLFLRSNITEANFSLDW